MSHRYTATVEWKRGEAAFTDHRYSRGHVWQFDGGAEVAGSSAPSSVPLPLSIAEAVDPEEALVASVSSCHMLFFLAFAAKAGFVVDRYHDEAVGTMTRNERGKLFISRILLDPRIDFSGDRRPGGAELANLHHHAHDECYIANSIRAEVLVAGFAAAHA